MNHIKLILILIITISFVSGLPNDSIAIEHFFNGKLTELKDINTPNDSYFGSSNSSENKNPMNSSVLIITTQNSARSLIKEAYGGGKSSPNVQNTITSTASLVVVNTDAELIVGGSFSKSHVSIGLSVDTSVHKVTSLSGKNSLIIYGGCYTDTPGSTQFIKTSIFMNISNSNAGKVCGLGNAIGSAPDHIAVGESVLINLNNSEIKELIIAGEDKDVNLGGKAFLFAESSKVATLWGTKKGNIGETLSINLKKSNISELNLTETGVINGAISVLITDSFVNNLNLGPVGPAAITKPVKLNISNSIISNITSGPIKEGFFLASANINLFSGNISRLQLGSNTGITSAVTFSMYGGVVNNLTVGSTSTSNPGPNSNYVIDATVNMSGGTITNLVTGKSIFSVFNFIKGGTSNIQNAINALGSSPFINFISFKSGSNTIWGERGKDFVLKVGNAIIEDGSKIFTAQGSKIILSIGEKIVINGGTFAPNQDQTVSPLPPLTLLCDKDCSVEITKPMNVSLSGSPDALGDNHLILASVGNQFLDKQLFNAVATNGLLWCNCEFNKNTMTWYASRIRPSQDFYGFSAARNASSWLRRQQIWNIQNRANGLLNYNSPGLWVNTQGGYEKLYTVLGKSKLSWSTTCMGYDFLEPLANTNLKILYGFSFSLGVGGNKWNTVNTTKNSLYSGIIDSYCGLIHSSGLYGTAILQLSACSINIHSPGFETKQKITEIIPTEALELGWKYSFNKKSRIITHGKIIFEQLPRHHITICGNDSVSFSKTLATTTSLGIISEYDFLSQMLTTLQFGTEWIKGISRDFSVKSKVLKKKFKENDKASVFRIRLGANTQVNEHFYMYYTIFTDVGDNKGLSGQIGFKYDF